MVSPLANLPLSGEGEFWQELTLLRAGISVFPPSDPKTGHPNNEVLGKSSIAGTYAVGQTAASRVLTNMCVRAASQFSSKRGLLTRSFVDSPTLILPPIIITLLEKRGAFKGPNGRRLSTVTNLGAVSLSSLPFPFGNPPRLHKLTLMITARQASSASRCSCSCRPRSRPSRRALRSIRKSSRSGSTTCRTRRSSSPRGCEVARL